MLKQPEKTRTVAEPYGKLDPLLASMLKELSKARKEILPSKFWNELNRKNLEQLQTSGYRNFKRTVALYYFTWIISPRSSSQLFFVIKSLPPSTVLKCALEAISQEYHEDVYWMGGLPRKIPFVKNFYLYILNFYTCMLWKYAMKNANYALAELQEPAQGGPFRIYLDGKLISQDLANSVLEFDSIMNPATSIDRNDVKTIIELGAGYGRNAYVFSKLMPSTKYIIVDIPPALYIAQKYLSSIFPKKKIFGFRSFRNYNEIQKEFEDCDIAFLLPNQLELLPNKMADLFINISSFHEMRKEQVEYYFGEVDRLTKSYFYFKQWKSWKNPKDEIVVTQNDYPVRKPWQKIYWRGCRVQSQFFEALFRV
jgi:putative sugar O-methyltransferase